MGSNPVRSKDRERGQKTEKETNQHSKKGEEEHFVGLDGQAGRETDDAEKKNRRSFVFTFCTRRQIR